MVVALWAVSKPMKATANYIFVDMKYGKTDNTRKPDDI